MKPLGWITCLFAFLLLGIFARPVQADGIIIPPPCPADCPPPPCRFDFCPPPRPISQLVIRNHHVEVSIVSQVATTKVDQVFYNPNSWAVEGFYVFPLPADAVVTDFKLWVDGEAVEGKVLNADEARKIYEDTVINLRDPALLEYIGRGAVQARIFPIPPQGERRIQLEYNQVLTADNGLARYIYPLNTEKFSQLPLKDASIRVQIESSQPVRAVYSPSHPVDITRDGEKRVLAVWEARDVLPDSDFSLYYSIGESEAFHLLTYRDPGDPQDADGFFLLLLAPKPDVSKTPIPKDVILVLDRSGSMDGEKFQQAQAALRFILGHLNPEDRFHLLAFSTGVQTYAGGMRPASEADQAIAWVDGLSASGSTDINRALLEAISAADAKRPTYLIFLTDGLATVGELDTARILYNIRRVARSNLRIFTFGIGYDVDTVLLDSLSQENHGLSSYVRPDESIDEIVSAFYDKISTPVMTDLALDFGSLPVYDLYPQPLPDLFSGSQNLVVGRYRGGGQVDVSLTGEVNGEQVRLTFSGQPFSLDSRSDPVDMSMIARIWATRKIGYLLNQVRIGGPDQEIIDQIVRLSVRYGIVTPYTSYLVTENMPLGAASQDKIANDAFESAKAAPMAPSGQAAVDRAAEEGQLQSAEVAPGGVQEGQRAIRIVGQRTFLFTDQTWMDTAYDPQVMKPVVVPFLSEAYFQLAGSSPEVAAGLALGERVILVINGKAYLVGDAGALPQPVSPDPTPMAAQTVVSPTESSKPTGLPTAQNGGQAAPKGQICASVGLLVGLVVGWLFLRKTVMQG